MYLWKDKSIKDKYRDRYVCLWTEVKGSEKKIYNTKENVENEENKQKFIKRKGKSQ